MNAKNAVAVFTAFVTVLLLVPLVIGACLRLGLVDRPGPLKIHNRPIPRLGGIAIAVALVAGTAAAEGFSHGWTIAAAFALVWLAGFIDDLRSLPPLARLVVQIASSFLLWHAGFRAPIGGNVLVNFLCTCVLVMFFVNALNFLDGSDGLAAGVTAIAALAFFLAALRAGDTRGAAFSCSLLGACAAFILFNFPPAKVFLGDSGSTLLGLALAFLALDFYHSNTPSLRVALFPVFVAALPLLDAALAMLRRLRRGRSLLLGDRRHVYDLALLRGYSAAHVALACFAFTAISSSLALLALQTASSIFLIFDGVLTAALWMAAVRLGAATGDATPARRMEASALSSSARPFP